MLIVPIEQARAGMRLVMTVIHPQQPDQELLKPGFVLDEAVIDRLRTLGVGCVYIDYPDLSELDRYLRPHLSPARQAIYDQIRSTIAAVQKTARPTVSFADYYAATRELIVTLLQNGEHPIYMDILWQRMGEDAVMHATTVAHMALTLGVRLQTYVVKQRPRLTPRHAREVTNLGVAAMLHDIGKSRLAERLRGYTAIRAPEEESCRLDWEAHPKIGGDMLRNGIEPSAVAAVVQHHEHFDGSGFPAIARRNAPPRPLAGQHIHVFARLILAADLYDRLATAEDGRRRPPVEILHLMRTRYWTWVDPYVLEMLPSVVPPFPPGSRLLLSDGSTAVVTAIHPDAPYSPTVRRLDPGDLTLKGDPLRVGAESGIGIEAMGDMRVGEMVRGNGGSGFGVQGSVGE
jgi:HD-GYP domain-containing protein (c-di-GMP phosphodiesterase class II)